MPEKPRQIDLTIFDQWYSPREIRGIEHPEAQKIFNKLLKSFTEFLENEVKSQNELTPTFFQDLKELLDAIFVLFQSFPEDFSFGTAESHYFMQLVFNLHRFETIDLDLVGRMTYQEKPVLSSIEIYPSPEFPAEVNERINAFWLYYNQLRVLVASHIQTRATQEQTAALQAQTEALKEYSMLSLLALEKLAAAGVVSSEEFDPLDIVDAAPPTLDVYEFPSDMDNDSLQYRQ